MRRAGHVRAGLMVATAAHLVLVLWLGAELGTPGARLTGDVPDRPAGAPRG